jgi:hypothetical protein
MKKSGKKNEFSPNKKGSKCKENSCSPLKRQ